MNARHGLRTFMNGLVGILVLLALCALSKPVLVDLSRLPPAILSSAIIAALLVSVVAGSCAGPYVYDTLCKASARLRLGAWVSFVTVIAALVGYVVGWPGNTTLALVATALTALMTIVALRE